MPSSTFSSESALVATSPDAGTAPASRAGPWASAALIALLLAYFAGIEGLFRVAVPRLSRIERRVATERSEAVAIRTGASAMAPRPLLLLGNSLTGTGIDFARVEAGLRPEFEAHQFYIDNTHVYDWHFGLRRLYDEGSRPGVVVLVLSPRQIQSERVRDEYFAYQLMRIEDLPAVARLLELSNTRASNLAFARYSAVFGLGAEVRNWLLIRALPDMPQLTRLATRENPPPTTVEGLYSASVGRLRAMRELAEAHSSRLLLVIPPSSAEAAEPGPETVRRAGREAGVTVLVPGGIGNFSKSEFSDGFHLNEHGAARFTGLLIDTLRAELSLSTGGAPAAGSIGSSR